MSERYGFRTSFRGFSRQDVLTHIDELRATFHEETSERDAEIASLKAQLDEARQRLSDAATAEQRETQLRAELETAQEAVRALTAQNEQLAAQLMQAQEAINASREQELSEALSETRAEIQSFRDRETALNSQLVETHQAVAALWQDKEALERKLAAAASFADTLQAQVEELKVQLGGAAAVEEKPTEKPMERWLF